jgi:hypothetical protein
VLIFRQDLSAGLSSNITEKFIIAIRILLEKYFRINQTLILFCGFFDTHMQELLCSVLHFQPNPD